MTEEVCQRFVDFDQWSTQDAVEAMYEGQLMAIAAVKPAMRDIALAADQAAHRLGKTGRLIYVGAGTSGRLAVQDGAELGPTFGWPKDRVVFCIAGGTNALTVSIEGAEDSAENGQHQIQNAQTGKNDIVIGVAASGRTPYTLGALQEANKRGAMTIGIANNPNTPLLKDVDYAILAETGSEIIAGSTRMKAGTAQKAVLNMLSTAIMTRLGHVYKGFMVDMVVSNKKLEGRALNMICDITQCSTATARASLKSANENIKTATLIALGHDLESAERIINQANGNLRAAFTLLKAKTD
ncbi:MAG: N-acetylmuramic acid 6-phosphate etherase [Robiginitomaculum sp.]|nr:MAG: N-acetylmuramic acid 6-phosphate etherase [Robiginitomaculum sp.]